MADETLPGVNDFTVNLFKPDKIPWEGINSLGMCVGENGEAARKGCHDMLKSQMWPNS